VLGAFKDVCFGVQEIQVSCGDRFYMYSDGLIEACGGKRVWTRNIERLRKACEKLNGVPFEECSQRLAHLMVKGRKEPGDDIVVIAVEI